MSSKYNRKKGSREKEVKRRYYNSNLHKILLRRTKEIKEDTQFQKELAETKKNFPLCDKLPRGGKKEYEAWENLSKKWHVNHGSLINGKVQAVWPIVITGIHRFKNSKLVKKLVIEMTSPLTERDCRDLLPVILFENQRLFGSPPIKSGRPSTVNRNKMMRKEFIAYRKKGKTREAIIATLAIKNTLSDVRTEHIISDKKRYG